MTLHGKNIIACEAVAQGGVSFLATNPALGEKIEPAFHEATIQEIDHALKRADKAFSEYRKVNGSQRADFLETIAEEIGNVSAELIQRANLETALPEARLNVELTRTTNQFRMF